MNSVMQVTDENLSALLAAERAILILTRSTCGSCLSYQAQIQELVRQGRLEGIVVGKVVLDLPGTLQFKRNNPWIAQLDHLPYTLLYRQGRRQDAFAASRGVYLLERIEETLAP